MNPAVLSVSLGSLFPAGAVVAELRTPGNPDLLLPTEAAHLGRAVPTRVQEFAAGRLCARRALAELGIVDFPLRAADDRQPIWPGAVVGSITHTSGFCAAVIAERARIVALGLDTEVVGDVNVEIWPSICTSAEIAWVGSQPAARRAAAVDLDLFGQGSLLQVPVPAGGGGLEFPRRLDRSGAVGRLGRGVPRACAAAPRGCPIRRTTPRRAFSVARGIRHGRHRARRRGFGLA